MDIVTSAGEMLADFGLQWIKGKVLGLAGEYRLRQFILALMQESGFHAGDEPTETEIFEKLDSVMRSEKSRELLFEAYKRVCLSSSKELGPRIIGLLTAQLLASDRVANEIEEVIFRAAEDLNDVDLRWVANIFRNTFKQPVSLIEAFPSQPGEALLYKFDGNFPPNVVQKLVSLGIARLVDMAPNTLNSSKSVIVRKDFEKFAELIDRAVGPST